MSAKKLPKIFAALGDETRLMLVSKLSDGKPQSISELTRGLDLSRQAVTKHLQVLEEAGLVKSQYHGRENIFQFRPKKLEDMKGYLEQVSRQWDLAIDRLKSFVEE